MTDSNQTGYELTDVSTVEVDSRLPMYILSAEKGPKEHRKAIPDHALPKAGSIWLIEIHGALAKVTVVGVTSIQEESLLPPNSTIIAIQLLNKVQIKPPDVIVVSNAVGQLFGYSHDDLVSKAATRASINRWIVYKDVNGVFYATLPYDFLTEFKPDRRKEKKHEQRK